MKHLQGDAFRRIPTEILFKIFSSLDLDAIRQARLVSKRWKLHIETKRQLKYKCCLTDLTADAVVRSQETFPFIVIQNLEKNLGVHSQTRGLGRVFKEVEHVQLNGSSLNATLIKTLLKYGVESLKTLCLNDCSCILTKTVFDSSNPFNSLQKLTIRYDSFPSFEDTMAFEKLAPQTTSFNDPALPVLSFLKIEYFTDWERLSQNHFPTRNQVFRNYLAVAQVIERHRRTLKTIKILRNCEFRRNFRIRELNESTDDIQEVSAVRIEEITQILTNNMSTLHCLHFDAFHIEGEYPWILESSLISQPSTRELVIDAQFCNPIEDIDLPEPAYISDNSDAFVTIVKLDLCCSSNVFDLSCFKFCVNLETLWLVFNSGINEGPIFHSSLQLVNVEGIPTRMKSLHFKSSCTVGKIHHQQTILSREQIRWIVNNLHDLESLWLQLVTPTPDGNNEDHSNINLESFKELISMPKLRDMSLDMFKASQFSDSYKFNGDQFVFASESKLSLRNFKEYTKILKNPETKMQLTAWGTAQGLPLKSIEFLLNRK